MILIVVVLSEELNYMLVLMSFDINFLFVIKDFSEGLFMEDFCAIIKS